MAIDYLAHVRADGDALVAAAASAPLSTPVPACPRWDLSRLLGHVGRVHRWCTANVTGGDTVDIPRPDDGAELRYAADALAPLLAALAAASPTADAGRWRDLPQVAGFWPRRMAHETAVHRYDAQAAVGDPQPIDAQLAVDGIDEVFDVFAPAVLAGKDGIDIGGSIHLHCTDTEGEWTFRTDDGLFQLTKGHAKGDVAVRGPASSLLLLLWRRLGPADGGLELFGDRAVLDRWLALGAP